jgi:hypothetical protein
MTSYFTWVLGVTHYCLQKFILLQVTCNSLFISSDVLECYCHRLQVRCRSLSLPNHMEGLAGRSKNSTVRGVSYTVNILS